jgi:hypothetical protein
VLSNALCHDIDIQDAYFDGILRVELGERVDNVRLPGRLGSGRPQARSTPRTISWRPRFGLALARPGLHP